MFRKLLHRLNNSVYCLVLTKIDKYDKLLKPEVKLNIEYLLELLLTPLPLNLNSRVVQTLLEYTRNSNLSPYIQYQFLMKYLLQKVQQKRHLVSLPLSKLEVYSSFFKIIFELELKKKKINAFLMYSFLRFASFIESPKRVSLIRRFGQFELPHRPEFWKNILFFMSRYVYYFLNPRDQMESLPNPKGRNGDKGFIQKIEEFFDEKRVPSSRKSSVPASRIRSYQDISELLMNMGLDIRLVTDVLLELGKACQIPLKQTTALLNRNQKTHTQHFSSMSEETVKIEEIMRGFLMRKFYQFGAMRFEAGRVSLPQNGYMSFRESKKRVSKRKAFGIFQIMKFVLPFIIGRDPFSLAYSM